ncbi:MAG TPA: helix-turn-helix transcriptional regulator [Saprospiraceae bacterium]|jgi:predicted transcriptional regulator|nr:helix-turn-helix transcriptional regulator [Saprospiraceae bacterium]HQW24734.1 helix-turn-helix transcriptional regulator [Saprospiraceae bacterium]
MNISIDKVIQALPKKRQKKINAKAKHYIAEYNTLQELRKELGITQLTMADRQGVNQVNISNLEKRKDMHLSTLRKYVEALGCELEINIRMPDDRIVRISNISRDVI